MLQPKAQDNDNCRFLLPASLIVINDIAAYIFGFFFGRTPLIKLSPKKTWEGFIGASFASMISAFVVSKPSIFINKNLKKWIHHLQ